MKPDHNKIACITGATSGIGAAFAEEFAKQGYDLIITGRRVKKIKAFAIQLAKTYMIHVDVVIADFSDESIIDDLVSKIESLNNLEILINNAGYGSEGYFCQEDSEAQLAKLHVSDSATIKLCHAVLPNMISNRRGAIINVSSLSACFPVPGAAMYSATRAFLVSFTESIYLELKGTGVNVQVLCPGTTKTDFHEKLGFDTTDYYKNRGIIKSLTTDQVVKSSLKYLKKDKVLCIPGVFNHFLWVTFKLIPRKLTYSVVRLMIKKRNDIKRNKVAIPNLHKYYLAS